MLPWLGPVLIPVNFSCFWVAGLICISVMSGLDIFESTGIDLVSCLNTRAYSVIAAILFKIRIEFVPSPYSNLA